MCTEMGFRGEQPSHMLMHTQFAFLEDILLAQSVYVCARAYVCVCVSAHQHLK